ncbi:MAG: pyruvate kinase [Eubacterium sp.]|nr:pyruvate kinase [Eubacterium sp.]
MEFYGTLGSACDDKKILEQMFSYGMTGVRLNLAHQSLSEASLEIGRVFKAAESEGVHPELLIDLQGPEQRIGDLRRPLELKEGHKIRIGVDEEIPVRLTTMSTLKEGNELLIDDGKIKLEVLKIFENTVKGDPKNRKQITAASCRILRGGQLISRKNISISDSMVSMPTLTEDDKKQLRLVKQYGVTGVMLPFVRGAGDIQLLKDELRKNDADSVRIFAKIENRSGYEHIGEIAESCDMIVVARGDLGNAFPLWELPRVQKEIAQVCKHEEKPFLVATQFLHTMEHSPVPTRAEVSDIYNAVLDGASALMLTGETAIGEYPVRAMRYLVKTANTAMMTMNPRIKELLDLP